MKMVLNNFLGPFQNVANSACPGSPFLSHGKIDKKNALFRENAFKLFLVLSRMSPIRHVQGHRF